MSTQVAQKILSNPTTNVNQLFALFISTLNVGCSSKTAEGLIERKF